MGSRPSPFVLPHAAGRAQLRGQPREAFHLFFVRETPSLVRPAVAQPGGVFPSPAPPGDLVYARAPRNGVDTGPVAERIRREVEETVNRTIEERVVKLVSPHLCSIVDRVQAELAEGLVLERERLGWS